jgi:hypothetical protein
LFLLVMGLTEIALLSISTMTMMYLLPRWDHVRNLPVWSENTCFTYVIYSRENISHFFAHEL